MIVTPSMPFILRSASLAELKPATASAPLPRLVVICVKKRIAVIHRWTNTATSVQQVYELLRFERYGRLSKLACNVVEGAEIVVDDRLPSEL